MQIINQQCRGPHYTAGQLTAPQDDEVSCLVTSESFLRQQSHWCRRMTGEYVLDSLVESTLLDLAREYEERLAAIEEREPVHGSDRVAELAAG